MEYVWASLIIVLLLVVVVTMVIYVNKKKQLNKNVERIFHLIKNINEDQKNNDIEIEIVNNQIVLKIGDVYYQLVILPAKKHFEISFNSPTIIQLFTRGKFRKIKLKNNYSKFNEVNDQFLIVILNNDGPYRRWINESDVEVVENGAHFWNITVANENTLNQVLSHINKT